MTTGGHSAPTIKSVGLGLPIGVSKKELAPEGTRLVMASLAALLLIRFFTETVAVLPRTATFIDVPILALVVAVAIGKGRVMAPSRGYFGAGLAFLAMSVISAVLNPTRVGVGPTLVFIYDFLSPLCFFFAVYRLWRPGNSFVFVRFLVAIGVVEFLVVAFFDAPKFLSSGDPDVMSGTFGDNAYQLVFFLLTLTSIVAATRVFQPRSAIARFAPLLFVGIGLIIFLAQYRAIIATALITSIVISFFLTKARPGAGFLVGVFVVLAFIGTLDYVSHQFPRNKLSEAVHALQSNPWFFVTTRIHSTDDILSVDSSNPVFILTGTGPGTFSSRAWRTFADTSSSRTAVASPYAKLLNGGEYHTDVADKYTVPRLQSAVSVQGSYALASPLSSYGSLVAEVGLPGFLLYVGIYVAVVIRMLSLYLRSRYGAVEHDPLPILVLGTATAFLVLLQLAVLDNWLEVTRITFLSWGLLAIVTREFDARMERLP